MKVKRLLPIFLVLLLSCATNPHRSAVRIYLQQHNAEKAVQEGIKWVKTSPQDPQAYLWLGVAYATAKDYEKAGENFHKAFTMDSTLYDTIKLRKTLSIGGVLMFSNEAIVTTLQNSASLKSKAGKYEEALRHFDTALKLDPSNSNLYLLKAGVYEKEGKEDLALKTLEYGNKRGVLSKQGLYFLGEMYLGKNRLEDAANAFRTSLEKDSMYDKALYGLGIVYFRKENYDSAKVALEKATKINPENADAWYNLGIAEIKEKDYQNAARTMRQYVSLKSDDAQAWFLLAASLYEIKKFDEALTAINNAIGFDATKADYWNYKGLILKKMGKTEEALKAFDKANKIEKGKGKGK